MRDWISFRMLYALNLEGKNKEEKESNRDDMM
jgi:hypothetical protein